MKKKLLILLSACLLLWACKSELDGTINEVAEDGVVDETEYARLIDEVKADKSRDREVRDLITEDGDVDEIAIQKYVRRKAKEHGIDSVAFPLPPAPNKPLACKFFLESSGSMMGYGEPSAPGGFFVSAVSQIHMRLQKGAKRDVVYVVNSDVTPTSFALSEFLKAPNPLKKVKVGNPSYTDFGIIFDTLLSHTNKDDVSVLVSDLIFSVEEFTNWDRDGLLKREQDVINEVFDNHPDKDVLVIKCNGGFDGNYFTYSSPKKGTQYKGKRPFYFMIVANRNAMHRLFTDSLYEEFRTFGTLPGYENYYCFTHENTSPSWAVLTKNEYMANASVSLRRSKGNAHDIDLSNPNAKRQRGRDAEASAMRIVLAIDMSNIYVQPDYLTDLDNYSIKTKGDWKIKDIIRLTEDEDVDRYITDYVPTATHLIVLESASGDFMDETVRISLNNKLPDWISKSSTNDDTRVSSTNPAFYTTTFGFETMMEGIYNAFYKKSDKEKYFNLSIDIKRAKR